MPPSSASRENYEQKPETNAINLREEYRKIVEQRAQEKSLLPKDKDACLKWLEQDSEGRDPQALKMRIDHLKSSSMEQKIKEQRDLYLKELEPRAKSGIIREETMQERLDWFLNELSFLEREEILKTKDSKKDDLFSEERVKVFNDFKKVFKYFAYLPLYKKFVGLELTDRKNLVAQLQVKEALLKSVVLPTIVREELKQKCVEASVDTCKKLVEEVEGKHTQLKDRFHRLPGPVQKEYLKKFKEALLPKRQSLLVEIEGKIRSYREKYSRKIKEKQTPGADGLTLFSKVSENVPGSSAYRYMHEWFLSKLTLKKMAEAIDVDPDLDNPERAKLCNDMGKILKTLPPKDKAGAIEKFNRANRAGRRSLIAQHSGAHPETAGIFQKAKEWLTGTIKNIMFSSKHTKVEETREAYAIGEVVAEQRRRYQIANHDHADAKPSEMVKKTEEFEKAVHSEYLHGPDGKVEINLTRLKTYKTDRKGVLRALKPTVYDPNAQLADTFRLRRRSQELVRGDVTEGYRDELEWARGELRESVGNVLETEALGQGLSIDKKEMQEVLEQTDWKTLGKEVIRKTPA